ncbi:MAG: DUF2934 domain-containing protein [Methylovulum miyakonense]|uniref:DUF2934 domain-containing protein n=1 Tax=Methylovulum miyakonense TaxID=645578 RepID=UPI003BB7D753
MKAKIKKNEEPVQEETVYIPDYDAKVSELAYYKAKNRGFEPGHELEDWFAAEQELQCCG